MTSRVLLVDGMAFLFRAFYATSVHGRFLRNEEGIPTNAVQGYLRHVTEAAIASSANRVIVCWDMGSKTFRNELYDGYKSNRGAPPEEMIPQFELAKDATTALSVPNVGLVGYEADDCIGTLAHQYSKSYDVMIATGDKDLLQCLDDSVSVWFAQKGVGNYDKWTKERFVEEVGLEPAQWIDVKALMGDTSDCYPGVPGVGEKTAIKFLQQFASIDGLYGAVDQLTPAKKKSVLGAKEDVSLGRRLATIRQDAPLDGQAIFSYAPSAEEVCRKRVGGLKLVGVEPILSRWFSHVDHAG